MGHSFSSYDSSSYSYEFISSSVDGSFFFFPTNGIFSPEVSIEDRKTSFASNFSSFLSPLAGSAYPTAINPAEKTTGMVNVEGIDELTRATTRRSTTTPALTAILNSGDLLRSVMDSTNFGLNSLRTRTMHTHMSIVDGIRRTMERTSFPTMYDTVLRTA